MIPSRRLEKSWAAWCADDRVLRERLRPWWKESLVFRTTCVEFYASLTNWFGFITLHNESYIQLDSSEASRISMQSIVLAHPQVMHTILGFGSPGFLLVLVPTPAGIGNWLGSRHKSYVAMLWTIVREVVQSYRVVEAQVGLQACSLLEFPTCGLERV